MRTYIYIYRKIKVWSGGRNRARRSRHNSRTIGTLPHRVSQFSTLSHAPYFYTRENTSRNRFSSMDSVLCFMTICLHNIDTRRFWHEYERNRDMHSRHTYEWCKLCIITTPNSALWLWIESILLLEWEKKHNRTRTLWLYVQTPWIFNAQTVELLPSRVCIFREFLSSTVPITGNLAYKHTRRTSSLFNVQRAPRCCRAWVFVLRVVLVCVSCVWCTYGVHMSTHTYTLTHTDDMRTSPPIHTRSYVCWYIWRDCVRDNFTHAHELARLRSRDRAHTHRECDRVCDYSCAFNTCLVWERWRSSEVCYLLCLPY